MPDEKKARSPTIQRLRGAELETIYSLSASLKEIRCAKDSMKDRFRSIPGAWRDICMLEAVLSKLIEQVFDTVPQDKLLSIKRNMSYMMYRVYLAKPVSVPADEAVVSTKDLSVLAKKAHDYACTACDSDCNKCELGQALDHITVQCRSKKESWSWIQGVGDYKGGEEML